ncbi:hypothetical protein DDM78_11495 [Vibrio cholerae]|uniref:polysaccharide deacetylase family protein n=1 Tax=Vibrio cholerae TaxID=666 RepID=UPI001DDCC675|nr:polysaccharide deacetylase family protein [Vibrio cholerae]EGR4199466.1 hypothetical protein [Vibrio cholerae]EGR4491694.1 hypothetical protein [Vibrio cholerae]
MVGVCLFSREAISWLENLLEERFGHRFSLIEMNTSLIIKVEGYEKIIEFDRLQSIFHESKADFLCKLWRPSDEGYDSPIYETIYAPSEHNLESPLININDFGAAIHYDILGLTYWILTRFEEVNRNDLDTHSRFPAIHSHAFRHGYLERPIVDEWLLILAQVIQRVWPNIELKSHQFSIHLSHDVDVPSLYSFKSWNSIFRIMFSKLFKKGDIKSFFIAPYIKLTTKEELHRLDPMNKFDWIMDVSESNDLKSTFFFISGQTSPLFDSDYSLDDVCIRNLLKKIHKRGHEIGLHPSYNTFMNPEALKREAENLKHICEVECISQSEWGARMHYLRWSHPLTMYTLSNAGINYDSTLGYADRPGFRCGTCHEYQAFDPVSQKSLNLRIKPLVVMECSVISSSYLGLGISVFSENKIKMLKERCRIVGGTFSLLWHNSEFTDEKQREMYIKILRD